MIPSSNVHLAEVLVVGAGPVGLMLAADLARRGVDVHIVDALPAPTTESRAIVLHARSLDHLEALGVLDEILDGGIRSTGMELHTNHRTIARAAFDGIQAAHPYSVSIPQTDTEAVLARRLRELGVNVDRSATLTDLHQDDHGVDAVIAKPDGAVETWRARYVVGADGARSTVRHLVGEHLSGTFSGDDFLIGDVEGTHPYERSHFHTFFSPGTETALLFPLPKSRVRVFAQLPADTDPFRPVTVDWLQDVLDERGVELRITGTHWLTRFELKHGQVARYRIGRAFLAGDAAHIHSPAGGLGMNTGIQDAANLGWKLALALATPASANLLDSYQAERHPVAAHVIRFTTAMSRTGTVQSPIAQHMRNSALHLGMDIPAMAAHLAGIIEQQNVGYRDSPIVTGSGGALQPGDFLNLPDSTVADALGRTTGHLLVQLASDDTVGPDHDDTAPMRDSYGPSLTLSESDTARVAKAARLSRGGIVIVRPDGYVGSIHDRSERGTTEYFDRLRR